MTLPKAVSDPQPHGTLAVWRLYVRVDYSTHRRYTWVIHDVAFKPVVCELNLIWLSALTGRHLGTDGHTHSDQNGIN
jgi:hypothetical protein